MIQSNLNDKTRYSFGVVEYEHRGVKVTSFVGSPEFDFLTRFPNRIYSFDVCYIPAGFEARPDLISDVFYNSPGYWWLLMSTNNYSDVLEDFKVGNQLIVPKI